jgi:alpha-tubulin suppressor-like RCC1 family protein
MIRGMSLRSPVVAPWVAVSLTALASRAGGDARAVDRATRVIAPAPSGPVSVGLGESFACGLDVSGAVRCWGSNRHGERGDGVVRGTDLSTPAQAPVLTDAVQLVAGYHHACARRRDGTVACWGGGEQGQLGDGAGQDRAQPALVPGLRGVMSLASGQFFTCALTEARQVWCWGFNRWRVVSSTGTERVPTPTLIPELRGVSSIHAGGDHACAVTLDGSLSCWGSNDWGQLGVGRRGGFRRPARVQGVGAIEQVALGGTFSCVRRRGGEVACWGQNLFSNGRTQVHPRPVTLTAIRGLSQLSCGTEDLCGVSADGSVRCWGVNRYHQSAPRSQYAPDAPERIDGLPRGLESVFVGANAICSVHNEGARRALWCWGHNDAGQLGTGATGDATTPARVRWSRE